MATNMLFELSKPINSLASTEAFLPLLLYIRVSFPRSSKIHFNLHQKRFLNQKIRSMRSEINCEELRRTNQILMFFFLILKSNGYSFLFICNFERHIFSIPMCWWNDLNRMLCLRESYDIYLQERSSIVLFMIRNHTRWSTLYMIFSSKISRKSNWVWISFLYV